LLQKIKLNRHYNFTEKAVVPYKQKLKLCQKLKKNAKNTTSETYNQTNVNTNIMILCKMPNYTKNDNSI